MLILVAIGNWEVIVVFIEEIIDLVFRVQVERPRNVTAIVLIRVPAVYDDVPCIGVVVSVGEEGVVGLLRDGAGDDLGQGLG